MIQGKVNRPCLAWLRGRYVLLLVFLLLSSLSLVYKIGFHVWDTYKLDTLEKQWEGFGPEKGFYDFTVVTGLFDIGRGKWWTQTRTYREYLGYLMQILMLDVNLVVFIEPKGVDFVWRIRQGRESRTKVFTLEISDLQYAPMLPRIKEIMNSKSFQENNDNYQKGKCEAVDPLYDLVTNSKVSLVHKAIEMDAFKTNYFIWLDGGYGHGDYHIYPLDHIWHPQHLLKHPDQITFIAFGDLGARQPEVNNLYKEDTAWMAGGLFAGGKAAMEEFHELHVEAMTYFMESGTIDDDQTTFLLCFYKNQSNFNPVHGDWYDLMKPFR